VNRQDQALLISKLMSDRLALMEALTENLDTRPHQDHNRYQLTEKLTKKDCPICQAMALLKRLEREVFDER